MEQVKKKTAGAGQQLMAMAEAMPDSAVRGVKIVPQGVQPC